jgi:phytoene desaturase
MGPSAFLLYLGLDREFPDIEHHTFYLAHRWKEHFDTIFDNKRWPDNPCYYICCPSKIDPTAAPKGKDLLFVLVPVAPGLDDNDMVRERFTEQIISHIEKTFGFPLRSAIETQHVVSHRDFIRDGNLYQGTALGLAHTLLQTAFLRPSHKSKRVKNLYFAGHYTQPGVGMPMVLIGAHLINDLITKRHGT